MINVLGCNEIQCDLMEFLIIDFEGHSILTPLKVYIVKGYSFERI